MKTSQDEMKTGLSDEIKSVQDKMTQNIQDMKTSQNEMKIELSVEIKSIEDK